ncbi:MAG: fibrobacter succinogenes major paralogous domain-containing protein, partial [Bacteroidales bacterium]|nr:fibrobacter succinogenes major paralogous domain-containing protein [Bacteroidales bacterium]
AVGFSGDYNDLTNKPTIPTVPANLSDFNNDLGLATVATTGSYNDLTNTPTIPTIPTQVSAFENDAQYLTRDSLSAETDPTVPNWAKESTKPTYDYAEIQNTPTIPTVPENVSVFTNDAGYITTSDLPTVNDAALTIQQNGSDLGTFTANQSSGQTVNIVTLTAGEVQALINSSLEPLQQQIDSVQTQNNALQSRLDDVNFICGTSTVRDYDGNIYNTVKIGNQCWLKENIRTTHYTDGEAIPDGAAYSHIDTDPYRWAPDTNEANVPTYGYLYTWAAVMHGESTSTANPSGVQGICPTGWHVPSNAEWTQLRDYVGSQSQYICGSDNTYIAKALADTIGWNTSGTTCAVGNGQSDNNATGFSALPAGERTGAFGSSSRIWSATEYESGNDYSYYITISSSLAFIPSISVHKSAVLSVRCVHDESSVMEQLQDIQEYNDGVQNAMQNHIDSLQNVIDDMNFLCGTSTVRDYDGNIYNTVMIDNQCWLKENMRTTHYANGDTIHDGGTSNSNTIPYRYAPNNDEANVATYGYLYNWTAAMHGASSSTANPSGVQGICPNGWHVPSHAEWTQLTGYVSGQNQYVCGSDYNNISKALADTMGWNTSSNTCAVGNNQSDNNATGFSALPAGYSLGSPYAFGVSAYFWTATQNSNDNAYNRAIQCSDSAVRITGRFKSTAFSVRCVRDERSVRDQLLEMQNQIDSFQNVIDGISFLCGTSTVRDYNGNTYHTVQIGTQCWLKENLKATSYSDGTPISQSNNSSYDTPYWYYPNNSTVNMATYGLLYNWKAVMRDATTSSANPSGVQGICPTGWHVPSSAEWTQLQDYVQTQSQYWCGGDNAKTGKALAAKTNWNTCATTCTVGNSPNDNNATGFSALPAGYRNGTDGNCLDFGGATRFWSTTEDGLYPAYHYYLEYDDTNLLRTTSYKNCGYSVRCIHN